MAYRPTPFSLALAALIALHCEPQNLLVDAALDVTEKTALQNEMDAFLQKTLLGCSDNESWYNVSDRSILTLITRLKEDVGSDIASGYLDWLRVAASSFDALTDLVTTLEQAVQGGSVDAESSTGVYIRQVCLGWEKLAFESSCLLWKNFVKQVQSVLEHQDNPGEYVTTEVLDDWPLSPQQMEEELRRACRSGELWAHNEDSGEIDSSDAMEERLQTLLKHNPELPSAHFLRFLHCLRTGERAGAIEAVHQYFDSVWLAQDSIKVSTSSEPSTPIENQQQLLQFAAIVLAVLYHSHGDATLSRLATEEAVRVAQQSQDASCVAFALGWLFQNESILGGSNQTPISSAARLGAGELIWQCSQRAVEGNLRSLAVGASLTLARHALQHDARRSTSAAWRFIQAATTDVQSTESSHPLDPPTHMTHTSSGLEALEFLSRQRTSIAGLWDFAGDSSASALASWLALHGSPQPSNDPGIWSAIQNVARRSLMGSPTNVVAPDPNGNRAYEYLRALDDSRMSTPSETSRACVYAETINRLLQLRDMYRLPVRGRFAMECALVVHEWATRRGDFDHASTLSRMLKSNLHTSMPNYAQLNQDVDSQLAFLRCRQGRYQEAKDILQKLLDTCQAKTLQSNRARLLLLSAEVQLESTASDQFTHVLPALLECLQISEDFDMKGLHAAALLVKAEVHARMHEPKQAIAVLRAALPTILQHEHVGVQAQAFMTLGKCHLQIANEYDQEKRENSTVKHWQLALIEFQKSVLLFELCHDAERLREIHYLTARIFHSLADTKQRDASSEKFVQISRYLTHATRPQSTDDVLSSLSDPAKLKDLAGLLGPGLVAL
jgi:tetratricopeptide (TPR) repeat protein